MAKKDPSEGKRPDFRTRLDLAETATIIFPLSEQVTSLLARYSGDCLNEPNDTKEKSPAVSLKKTPVGSPKL